MASKRFLIVPEDSSAASRPLPGATMARATLLRSARFNDASFRAVVLASQSSRFSGDSQENTSRKRVKKTRQEKRARKMCVGRGGRLAARSGVAACHAT